MRRRWMVLSCAGLTCHAGALLAQQQPSAFPGAVGFGAGATGGRGGSVYVVTNLNDSGAGSFRDAVSHSNRIVVFNVGGYINLSSPVSVASNITIEGQTAPGDGIGVKGSEVSFDGSNNEVVRYFRFRDGSIDANTNTSHANAINLGDTNTTIFDHVSAEFASYNNVDAHGNVGAFNMTFQNSLLADPIKNQQFNFHLEGGGPATFINNVWANAHNRNPLGKDNLQYVNNVVYNYQAGFTSGNSAGKFSYDLLNNYFIAGPSTSSANDAWYQLDSNQSGYSSGNLLDSNKNGALDGSATSPGGVTVLSSPWSATTQSLPLLSTAAAYAYDVAHSGPSLRHDATTFAASLGYDTVDAQVMSQVNSLGTQGTILNTENGTGLANGGFGMINGGAAPTDSNNNGIADAWETAHGLQLTDTTGYQKLNPLGYTMLEQYANELADANVSVKVWSSNGGDWNTAAKWTDVPPGIYDVASVQAGAGGAGGLVTVTQSSNAPAVYQLFIGGGTSSGEKVVVSGGTLHVYDTVTVGASNNGTLEIDGGVVTTTNVQLGNTLSGTTTTGILALNGGTLRASQVVLGGGTPGAWNTGGSINWNGGTLQAVGGLFVNAPATLGAGGGIVDTNGNNGSITGVLSGAGSFTKLGSGTLSVTGSNTYIGRTAISGGVLSVATLANGNAASPLGQSSNAAANLVFDGGTLQYVGAGGASDRLFTLTSKGGTLDSSGTITNSGAVAFTNTGAIALPSSNVTMTFTGTNTNHNTFSTSLADPGSGFLTSVIKTGAGKWTFNTSNNKTYSGTTQILQGTLESLIGNAFSKFSDVIVSSGATLELHATSQTIDSLSGAGAVNDSFGKSGDTLTMGANNGGATSSGTLGNGSPLGIVKTGTGNQILSGVNTYSGSTTVSGGTLTIGAAGSLPSGSAVTNNASLAVNANTTAGNVSGTGTTTVAAATSFTANNFSQAGGLANSGTAQINGSGTTGPITGGGTLTLGTAAGPNSNVLALASGSGQSTQSALTVNTGSTLDVTNNSFDIHYGAGTSPDAAVRGYLVSGYNGGNWQGTGITSSTAAADTVHQAVGYADGADNVVAGLAAGDELIKYSFAGDANLDGKVDVSDLGILATNYGHLTGQRWDQGDFTYDSGVDVSDLGVLATNYGAGTGVTGAAAAAMFQSDLKLVEAEDPAFAAAIGAVPEPASLTLLGLGALGLLARRKRR